MNQYRQISSNDTEAGGVLLGRFVLHSNDIVIDYVTTPKKSDVRKRFFYVRNRDSHQKIIDRIWKWSCGTCNYLGEWHTHPEKYPNPSSQDLKNWKRILKESVVDYNVLFFVIVGTKSVGVWEGNVVDCSICQLVVQV